MKVQIVDEDLMSLQVLTQRLRRSILGNVVLRLRIVTFAVKTIQVSVNSSVCFLFAE